MRSWLNYHIRLHEAKSNAEKKAIIQDHFSYPKMVGNLLLIISILGLACYTSLDSKQKTVEGSLMVAFVTILLLAYRLTFSWLEKLAIRKELGKQE